MSKRVVKTCWHGLVGLIWLWEFNYIGPATSERKTLHKLMCGAAAGWHLAAAVMDWKEDDGKPDDLHSSDGPAFA